MNCNASVRGAEEHRFDDHVPRPDFGVADTNLMNYFRAMSQQLEQRVEDLEKKVAHILGLHTPRKDWRTTVGSLPDDELTRAAEQLGREYRQQQTCEKEIARS